MVKKCDKCSRFFLFMHLNKVVDSSGEDLIVCDVCFDPNLQDKRFHSRKYPKFVGAKQVK